MNGESAYNVKIVAGANAAVGEYEVTLTPKVGETAGYTATIKVFVGYLVTYIF